MEVSSTG